jgi:hypothetical protein
MHGARTGDAALDEMIHESEEERQVALGDALFIEGKDEEAGARV